MIKAQVKRVSPGRTTMELSGLFDRSTAPALRKDILKVARESGSCRFEIDLANASCTDTSCIAVMVEVLRTVRRKGGALKLSGVSENTAKMISLSQLDYVFRDVIDPRDRALDNDVESGNSGT